MKFQTASLTRQGGRDYNEDDCGYELAGDTGCWIVADGLGGHGGGDVASKVCVEEFLSTFRQDPSCTSQMLQNGFNAAQSTILEKQQEQSALSSMRTTAVTIISDGHSVLWGHIGDTRLYHFRKGSLRFQTKDHSVPQAMVAAGDIRQEDIRYHEDRNRLIRSLGHNDRLDPSIEKQPVPLDEGDAFLLCTDGFWEYVLEAEMAVDLAKSTGPQQWLAIMEERLLQRTTDDNDNYTALALFVEMV